jgi:hypothetical protein
VELFGKGSAPLNRFEKYGYFSLIGSNFRSLSSELREGREKDRQ